MRLDLCLLADAVAANPQDGKLFIHGGGITRITPLALPWVQALAVAVRFEVEEEDQTRPHAVEFSILDPAEEPIFVSPAIEIPPLKREETGEDTFLQLATNLGVLHLIAAGSYTFSLKLDGHVIRRLALRVAEPPTPRASVEKSLNSPR
jgi:hypothetical protein